MRHRNVSDLMTTSVITVRRDTTFKEIAGLLAEHDITAVPVVDDNDCPVGMVSEADLLRKQAGQPAPAGLLSGAFQRSEPGTSEWHADLAKAAATSAEWLMTSPAVTARSEWTVVEAARVMEQHKVKRLPVVNEAGQLVGLVSRGDLLRVFLRRDRAIREEITDDVLVGTLRLAPTDVTVNVVDGQVTLTGTVERRTVSQAMRPSSRPCSAKARDVVRTQPHGARLRVVAGQWRRGCSAAGHDDNFWSATVVVPLMAIGCVA